MSDRWWYWRYWLCLAPLVAMTIFVVVAFALGYPEDDPPPPYGCAWVNLGGGKTSDLHLACLEGYEP